MDIVSFNEASTANGRIESFIENPDSTSGVVTVPTTIAAGETITIPAGRMAVLPDLQIDGDLVVDGEVFIPNGTSLSKVVEKVTSTDNAIVRFDGVTGAVQNSAITIDDNGNIGSGTQSFNGFGGSGFKNYIINGNFDIWQRGTSFTSNEYNADRWFAQFDGNCTVSNEWVSYNNTAKLSWTSAGTYKNFLTSVEDGARKLQGKTLTLSFMAKASTAGNCSTYIGRGQGAGISVVIDSVTINLTTSWQKFTRTFTMPAYDNTNMTLVVGLISMQLLGSSNTVWIKEVQLEEGSVATPFENRPIGLELSLCQRYYEVGFTKNYVGSTTGASTISTQYKVIKRAAASCTYVAASFAPTATERLDSFGFTTNRTDGTEQAFFWLASAEL